MLNVDHFYFRFQSKKLGSLGTNVVHCVKAERVSIWQQKSVYYYCFGDLEAVSWAISQKMGRHKVKQVLKFFRVLFLENKQLLQQWHRSGTGLVKEGNFNNFSSFLYLSPFWFNAWTYIWFQKAIWKHLRLIWERWTHLAIKISERNFE